MSTTRGRAVVRADLAGTVLFLITLAFAVPLRNRRPAQFAVGGLSMVLFAAGIVAALLAYATALERSRHEEVGVANVYLLTGDTAPAPVRRALLGLLAAQVVAALSGAAAGMIGLDEGRLNALAFGVLVPMFGVGLNGLWGARYGAYGPRADPAVAPSNKRIG